jgi:(2R)-ethylmalonyl-CoA mutase
MFRYGVQVNSLGLHRAAAREQRPPHLIEMLAVTLSKKARPAAVQLPAWNEALGLPRPGTSNGRCGMQQISPRDRPPRARDLFDGSHVMEAKVESLKAAARAELARIDAAGGAIAAVESGSLKRALVESNARRIARVESGEQVVVGVNRFTEGEASPLMAAGEGAFMSVPESVETEAIHRLRAWRTNRDAGLVEAALAELESAAREDRNIMPASIAAAKAGVTTGEWGETLREVFGQYRAPTGVSIETASRVPGEEIRLLVSDLGVRLGAPPRMVVGKPGLDGHSNGAEQIALRARDVGMEVTYDGIRQTPSEIVAKAASTGAHVIGLSILSGSHVPLVREVMARLRLENLDHIPLVVGGIISAEDELVLRNIGVAAIYTPKDYALDAIMTDIVRVIDRSIARRAEAEPPPPSSRRPRAKRASA